MQRQRGATFPAPVSDVPLAVRPGQHCGRAVQQRAACGAEHRLHSLRGLMHSRCARRAGSFLPAARPLTRLTTSRAFIHKAVMLRPTLTRTERPLTRALLFN